MSETIRNLTCINCPLGCSLTVKMDGDKIISITGNTCPRGEMYAKNEVTDPKRVVTSSVHVNGGERSVVSVKTKEAIPKGMIFECANAMRDISATAPVKIGDVIIDNIAGTGIELVATANVEKMTE